MGSRAAIDRPMATVEAVNTVAPILYHVHTDHLHRPVKMTNAAKAVVWDAVWQPFGGLHSLTGTGTLSARLPGQWFQAETGLHYNWHRSYDPTLGRYTQPDPLGFVDGPSVYGYAGGSPQVYVDPDGRQILTPDDLGKLAKPIACEALKLQVLLYCKNFPVSLFTTNQCKAADSCEMLEAKFVKRRKCIDSQKLITALCFPDDPTHTQRLTDERNGADPCRRFFSAKGCGCLPPIEL